jgi:DNA-binding response OmpR family regulator
LSKKAKEVWFMKLLLAEDEYDMSEALVDILTYHKYIVDAVYDGAEALDYARNEEYDGIILDIMMPKKNGLEVLRELRNDGCTTPVLLLTAKSEIEDKVQGLDMGADDYLPKPFVMEELLARIRAMLRRKERFTPDVLAFGDVSLNLQSYELKGPEKSIVLPKQEYQLMELFMMNQNIYLSSEKLLEKIWGYDTNSELGNVWVYISNLRKRLKETGSAVGIQAKRNIGYRLEK